MDVVVLVKSFFIGRHYRYHKNMCKIQTNHENVHYNTIKYAIIITKYYTFFNFVQIDK